jgi:multidrug efflux system membrane fusion protein
MPADPPPTSPTPPPREVSRPRAPRRRRRAALAFLLALLALGTAGCWYLRSARPLGGTAAAVAAASAAGRQASAASTTGRHAAGGSRLQPVTVARVQQRDLRSTMSALGTIAAANMAVVRSRVDGPLVGIDFTEGRPVRAGQVLARIDPRPFEVALAQARGQLARDQAQLRNAQLDLARYRDLVAKEAAPKQQLDTQEALVQQLQGTVLSDQAAVDNAQLQLGYTRVTAPIAGVPGLRQVDLGNLVHATDTNGIVAIAQIQPVAVVFAVPDTVLPRIRQQLGQGAALPVQAWDRAQQHLLAEGQVASIDNAIDPTTGTIRVKALFPNADGALYPNQSVDVRLQLDTLPAALAVPGAAVQRGAPGSYVYVVDADGGVQLRRVEAGVTDGDWTAVQGPLRPGEQVVIDGADRLRDGGRAEVVPAASDAASGALAGGRGGRHHGAQPADGTALAPVSAAASAALPEASAAVAEAPGPAR